tara:strand:+ start:7435 stop:7962 length:528 start_codon:yes stop_codon:yes gene_type:complete
MSGPNTNPSSLGGGAPGSRPEAGYQNVQVGGAISLSRSILRRAFKSNNVRNGNTVISKANCGPFRASNHGGDVFSRFNLSCGATNQINRRSGQLGGLRLSDGVNNNDCSTFVTVGGSNITPKDVKLASSNVRFVYDSSDYTRFKKMEARNKTYNDLSFGGDQHNGSYTFLNNLRG